MTLLVITHHNRDTSVKGLFEPLIDALGGRVVSLGEAEQKRLPSILKQLNINDYKKVFFDIPFKCLWKARRATRRLHRPMFLEEDACQNFLPFSRRFGKFSTFYQMHSGCRVLCSGFRTASALALYGIDTQFLPKVSDTSKLYNAHQTRDWPCIFVGRTKSSVYQQRLRYVDALQQALGLRVMRVQYPDEYRQVLNRSRVFFSADVGLNEYMMKNFQAMSCGCAVVAYEQGWNEERALGLEDGKNIVLYRSVEEAIEKTRELIQNEPLRQRIAQAGQQWVEEHLSYNAHAKRLLQACLDFQRR